LASELPPEAWLSLSDASRILSVNPATLRRWVDAGRIRAFRTPGGHRRLSSEDVGALARSGAALAPRREAIVELPRVALEHIRRRLHGKRAAHEHWFMGFDDSGRERARPMGRRLLSLVGDYMSQPRDRTRLLEEARVLGQQHGLEAARLGLSLNDALEAGIFFRRSVGEILEQVARAQEMGREQAMESYRLANALVDDILLATMSGYQEARAPRTEGAIRDD
jgi:excisionase family DNA binding protein